MWDERKRTGPAAMVIIGIDPGFAITGYGIVKYEKDKLVALDYGVISTDALLTLPERLLLLSDRLGELIENYKPRAISVEELFFNKNIKTALAAAHGRGVALLSACRSGAEVFEYTPLQVKQAVAGYGRADKRQVQQMVRILLGMREIPKPDDAADALAVAICHAHSCRMAQAEYEMRRMR